MLTGLLLLLGYAYAGRTPLDDYINSPDTAYNWTVTKKWSGTFGFTAYDLYLTSQNWLSANDSVNGYTWYHWVQVCVPDRPVQTDLAFLYIDGGSRPTETKPPSTVDGTSAHLTELLCVDSQTISVAVLGIPMESICFAENDPGCYTEDGLIAYTWRHFYNDSSNPNWLLRLPMVKAVVKAMDAVSEFTATLGSPVVPVARYVVAGASKRGWTTWLTAAVDPRVVAIIPMVMPILNIVPNMNHHHQAYNGWSFALADYIGFDLMGLLNTPYFLELASIVDPWSYRDRLTMPKLILSACGDEFFLPDSPQFFMKGLQEVGETHLTVIANAEHSLASAYVDVGETLCAFYHTVLYDLPRPNYTYSLTYGNQNASISVTIDPSFPATYVKVWKATTLARNPYRDFRLVICDPNSKTTIPDCIQPVVWTYEYLSPLPNDPNTFVATETAPAEGWTGFEIEMTWQYNDHDSMQVLKMSSEVNVVPYNMPSNPCGFNCQPTDSQPDQFGIYH